MPEVVVPEGDDLRGLRIGVPRQLNDVEGIEPGVKDAVAAAIAQAEALGASADICELPLSVDYGIPCYYLIAPAEASANLARYDGVRYGLRTQGESFRAMVRATRHDGFGDEVKRRIMLGTYALSSGYYDAYYGTAQKVRTVIKREHDKLFERFDVLVSPTSPTVAFPIGEKAADPLAMYLCDVLTIPSNMAGLPGLSVPCGLSDGLPVGLQLIGPQFAENTLFRVAHALETAIGFDYVPERLR
jgi:aspartyl-tRNA(Asn)/glutamyl-tRNA(Gln) amidotransferase subunit A